MKRFIASLLAMAAISVSAGELKDTVDRFKGSRVVAWEAFRDQTRPFSFSSYAYYVNSADKAPYGYYSVLVAKPGVLARRECAEIDWLIDGTPDRSLKATSSDQGAAKSFMIQMSRPELSKLAAAKSIEFRACGVEGKIDKDDVDGLIQVLKSTE